MTTASKKNLTKHITTLLVLTISTIGPFATPVVFARSDAVANTAKSTQLSEANFCAQLSTISTRLNSQVDKKIDNIGTIQDSKTARLTQVFDERNSKLAQSRAKWDENRNQHYQKLYDNAKNDDQKKAIDQFRATVEAAVVKRRTVIDQSISTYRDNIAGSLSSRQGSLEGVINGYKSDLSAAQARAQSSCSSGTSSSVVRQTFRSDLQTARTNLQNGKQGIEKIGTEISEATKVRQAAIDQAVNTFKTTLQNAKEDLKAALGQ